jgi:pimeloyl-ACP methyl ester carboxylesterase
MLSSGGEEFAMRLIGRSREAKLRYFLAICIASFSTHAYGQRPVTFPLQGKPGKIQADLYGSGTCGVILAHGGSFNKESWKKQAQAFADAGFLVLAIRFRGDASSPDGSPGSFGSTADNAADVLAAVSYLHRTGAKTVSAVGASLGGDAVGEADAQSKPGNIARIVFLGSSGGDTPQKLTGGKLFIVARNDSSASGLRLPEISRNYQKAPQPKKLVILEGSAHAQYLFDTDQGPRLLNEVLRFLSEP